MAVDVTKDKAVDNRIEKTEDFAAQLDWGDGWNRVIEDNGYPRAWPNDRIQEGVVTAEVYDKENEKLHLSAFLIKKTTDGKMRRIDWMMKYGVVSLIHGLTNLGFVHMGRPLGWKHEGHVIKGRFGYLKGSEMMDFLYKTYVQPMGTEAGYSLGGSKLHKECFISKDGGRKCDVTDVDSWDFAWTPDPMNQEADVTKNNPMAKSEVKFVTLVNAYERMLKSEYGVPKTDEERLKDHFGEDDHDHDTDDLPPRGTGRAIAKAEGQVDPDETKLSGKKMKPFETKSDDEEAPSLPYDEEEFAKGVAELIKAKRYLAQGEQPPKGATVHQGERGGKYIEEGGGRGGDEKGEKPKKKEPKYEDPDIGGDEEYDDPSSPKGQMKSTLRELDKMKQEQRSIINDVEKINPEIADKLARNIAGHTRLNEKYVKYATNHPKEIQELFSEGGIYDEHVEGGDEPPEQDREQAERKPESPSKNQFPKLDDANLDQAINDTRAAFENERDRDKKMSFKENITRLETEKKRRERDNKSMQKCGYEQSHVDQLLEKCSHSRDYVSHLMLNEDMDIDQAMGILAKSVSYVGQRDLLSKGNLCQCKECGYSMLSSRGCMDTMCPVCGSEMRVTIYPLLNKSDGETMDPDKEKQQEILEEPPTPEPEEEEKKEDDITKSELWKGLKTLEKTIVGMEKSFKSQDTMLKDIQGLLKKSKLEKDGNQDEDTLVLEEESTEPSGEVAPGTDISYKSADGTLKPAAVNDEVLIKSALARGFKIHGYEKAIADNKPDAVSQPVGGVRERRVEGEGAFAIAAQRLEDLKTGGMKPVPATQPQK